ncbi:MAG: molybdopterin molybdotransferase MoeA [Firmicutes bacterium]|nr:molybdopterin molybdotransferase MoeA [Bacillota bacterium]
MFQVKTFDETISILKSIFSSFNINAVEITILESLNRVLSEDIHCREDLPGFSRSTMDGFAVKAKNTFGASASLPAMLDLVGEVRMGEVPKFTIQDGQACYIPTGGMLPEGADSVVMIEYAERIDDINVLIERPVSPGENVIHKGEDIKAGDLIFEKGHIIRPQDIGVLSSAGIKTVPVAKRLEFGILSTGNEIADPFQPLP